MSSGAGAHSASPQAAAVAPRSAFSQLVRDYVTLTQPTVYSAETYGLFGSQQAPGVQ